MVARRQALSLQRSCPLGASAIAADPQKPAGSDRRGRFRRCLGTPPDWCDGKFYLIYSNVHNFGGTFYDVDNYLVTASDIRGPWSEPVFLNSSGFDPSLFHAPDGRKYLLNMAAEYRTWKVRFAGIMMQEYSEAEGKLIGEPRMLWRAAPAARPRPGALL